MGANATLSLKRRSHFVLSLKKLDSKLGNGMIFAQTPTSFIMHAVAVRFPSQKCLHAHRTSQDNSTTACIMK